MTTNKTIIKLTINQVDQESTSDNIIVAETIDTSPESDNTLYGSFLQRKHDDAYPTVPSVYLNPYKNYREIMWRLDPIIRYAKDRATVYNTLTYNDDGTSTLVVTFANVPHENYVRVHIMTQLTELFTTKAIYKGGTAPSEYAGFKPELNITVVGTLQEINPSKEDLPSTRTLDVDCGSLCEPLAWTYLEEGILDDLEPLFLPLLSRKGFGTGFKVITLTLTAVAGFVLGYLIEQLF